ncbi:MAG: 16S rRNA (guanine(966)-N(2))-methyltransferase RsmD [Bdellovibrionales bacterium]|nr:16S rRNA (guanine(966)-N(2))-methyltransferase RsmD [Bdellovibrionales bacterium]
MRVISGKYKGRRLVSFDADHIRPTSDRVKESVFNIIFSEIEGAEVLDLFSGTGNIAIEFSSRGAKNIDAVELNKKSLQILKKNIDSIGIDNIQVMAKDVFKFLSVAGKSYDIIFIDPPFTEKIADKVMLALKDSRVFHPNTIIIIESSKFEKMDLEYLPLKCYDQRKFGDKSVSFFRKAEA